MKKFICVILSIVCSLVVAFSFSGCSNNNGSTDGDAQYVISTDVMEIKLREFMSNGRYDRTQYTLAEYDTAKYLANTLIDYGYDDENVIREFSLKDDDGTLYESQNVVVKYLSATESESVPNVIIGAYYDNVYALETYSGSGVAYNSDGALSNGTGVATLLAVAEWLQTEKPQLDFDVTIAFFGASAYTNTGVTYYYAKQMSEAEKSNTVLMIELQRIGAKHLYAFSDYRKNSRESFFDGVAKDNGLDIYKASQKSPAITSLRALNGVPFFQWVQSGNFSVFFNENIPTLNLVGADWETIDITDREGGVDGDISYTENDSLSGLIEAFPEYSNRMAEAATLVIKSLTNENFLSTMQYDKDNFPNTNALSTDWIWHLVVLGIVVVGAAAMMLINKRLAKKYPISVVKPTAMPNVKMAVFGVDYEDVQSGDIFIDLKRVDNNVDEDIFPGVPNNDNNDVFGMNNSNGNSNGRGFDVFGEDERSNDNDGNNGGNGKNGDNQ